MNLGNKVAVVTGAARGIGAALARRFGREGARGVVAADIDEEALTALAREIDALAVPCDVSREADVGRVVSAAEDAFGPIDVF